MNRFFKSLLLATAVAATTLVPVLEASAGQRWREHRPRHPEINHRQNAKDDLLAAGILGLVVGGLIVGAVNSADRAPAYIDDYPDAGFDDFPPPPQPRQYRRRVVDADPYAGGGYQPWTREWMRYCQQRYRSFNVSTGTYRGYDGKDHFCVAD
ncbi:BA14K family protein [Nitratireductor sp. CAU 1489]|uniref:Lectin-like protein BA14k n=1 Tax=Nitratireductor arenosus TaxID=2682096 RepID=A0A844QG47_9HYPH|nr:BA14K family protein [Nitratireductor arenosus]MVA96980.1 BA14K family protein [Nitratireductor arenosus]